ncbi:MAG: hypothetical protein WDN69_31760 [Aliidongia sp.]
MSPAFVLPESWRAVRLVMVRPQGWVHAAAVAEVMEGLFFALRSLGADVDFAENQPRDGGLNIYSWPSISARSRPTGCRRIRSSIISSRSAVS